jgi:hypothetical protein
MSTILNTSALIVTVKEYGITNKNVTSIPGYVYFPHKSHMCEQS